MAKKAESGGYARLKGDLAQKTPGSFYVLYGEEDYLRRYYLSMLRRQLVDGPTENFNFHRLTSENFSMQVLSESLEALPMMAERTMIQVDDVDLFALPEDDRTQLAALFSDIPDYACLVLVYADFKPDKRKKKLWDAMEKNAVLAEFAYQTERDLTAWIVRHFRAEKKNISPAQAPCRAHPAGGREDLAGPCFALRRRAVCGQQVLCAGAAAVGPLLRAGRAAVLRGRPADEDVL